MTEPLEPRTLSIPVAGATLEGDSFIPQRARGVVVFAHGSGSSRKSVRNRLVAQELWRRRLGTLLFDLLTPSEERADGRLRFDIPFLAERLCDASDWLRGERLAEELPLGYFGASTGAAAALVAAAERPAEIRAIVSRGGRPDLAGDHLAQVRAPTLLIVGSADRAVLDLNRQALRALSGERKLEIVAGATHLFEEAGALEAVAHLAGDWFVRHLTGEEHQTASAPSAQSH